MAGSNAGLAIKFFFIDFLGGIAFFPVWWYTRGLKIMASRAFSSVSDASKMLGLGVWVKNLFVPMYGETSWQGKLISFGVRLFMIIFRGLGVLAWTVAAFVGLIIYLAVLPLAIIGVVYHVTGLMI